MSASMLLAVTQASSLHPASTVPLESFDRLMALSRDERTLYSGFQPPMPQRSYDEDYVVVASTRSLGEILVKEFSGEKIGRVPCLVIFSPIFGFQKVFDIS